MKDIITQLSIVSSVSKVLESAKEEEDEEDENIEEEEEICVESPRRSLKPIVRRESILESEESHTHHTP